MSSVETTTFIRVVVPAPNRPTIIIPDGVVGALYRGPAGSGSEARSYFDFVTVADGIQVFNLPILPISITDFYINGLRQLSGAIAVVGMQVTAPAGLNIIAGDIISTSYTHF